MYNKLLRDYFKEEFAVSASQAGEPDLEVEPKQETATLIRK